MSKSEGRRRRRVHTPEFKAEALAVHRRFRFGGPYTPTQVLDQAGPVEMGCPGVNMEVVNAYHPAVIDPTTGMMYASHRFGCASMAVVPGAKEDAPDDPRTTGKTISEWVRGPGRTLPLVQNLPIFKPPYNRMSAYNMNTGDVVWQKKLAAKESAPADLDTAILDALDHATADGLPRGALRAALRVRNERLGEPLTRLAAAGHIARHGDAWVRLAVPAPLVTTRPPHRGMGTGTPAHAPEHPVTATGRR
jgi:hypothetical protein